MLMGCSSWEPSSCKYVWSSFRILLPLMLAADCVQITDTGGWGFLAISTSQCDGVRLFVTRKYEGTILIIEWARGIVRPRQANLLSIEARSDFVQTDQFAEKIYLLIWFCLSIEWAVEVAICCFGVRLASFLARVILWVLCFKRLDRQQLNS